MAYREYRKARPTPYGKLTDPQAEPLMNALRSRGLKVAVASSSAAPDIMKMLTEGGLKAMVDFAFSGEDCAAHKPAPDIYLKALEGTWADGRQGHCGGGFSHGHRLRKGGRPEGAGTEAPPRRAAGPVRRRLHHHPADGCKGASGLRWKRSRTVCAKPDPGTAVERRTLFLLLNLSLIICAAALNFYCAPNHFVFGGTIGLSIVLATCFPALSVSTFMWITNAVLDVLGCVFLGIKTMGWTLYSSLHAQLLFQYVRKLFPMSRPLTDDTLLELCFAVALPALASGIVFNIGASTGGTEIVAMILHKYIKVEIGRAILLSDIGTVLFAVCIYGPQTGMYCVLGLIGRSTIVDTAIESLNLRKVCTVITSRPEPIRRFVTETLGRTATQQDATGVYTGEPRTMIMVALTRRQAGLLRDFLRREDPEAFDHR